MKHSKMIIAAMLMALAAPVLAAENGAPASSGDAKLDAARNVCAEKAGKDSNGRPDREAMDTCMKAKGYTKPAGK